MQNDPRVCFFTLKPQEASLALENGRPIDVIAPNECRQIHQTDKKCPSPVSFSAYLIDGEVEDVVFQSGCRMWCAHLAAAETTAAASSAPGTAAGNSSDLAGERARCMRRGDCR